MKPLVTYSLPESARHTSLAVQVVPTSAARDMLFILPLGPLPDCDCVVRTVGPAGIRGPAYYRSGTVSALNKAAELFLELKARREGEAVR